MNPVLVDSIHCHLWTDALHVRQLARQAANRWDRGTYVRLCVTLTWTAVEVACQDALEDPRIGYSFKDNLDSAISNRGLSALDWSQGIWQEVRRLQDLRKSFIHKFALLSDMFPTEETADDAIQVARRGIVAIYQHVSKDPPAWVEFDHSQGWAQSTGASEIMRSCMIVGGISPEDPDAIRVCYVEDRVEHVAGVYPPGFDHAAEVARLVKAVNVPITAVRVYEGAALIREVLVHMRGN